MEELCTTVVRNRNIGYYENQSLVRVFKTIDAAGWYVVRIFSTLELFP